MLTFIYNLLILLASFTTYEREFMQQNIMNDVISSTSSYELMSKEIYEVIIIMLTVKLRLCFYDQMLRVV